MRRAATEVFEAATETPVINVLMMSALYVIWIPALCLWVCARRSPRWIPLFIPVVFTVGAVLMSPMYDTRYALPMIYTAPVLLCFCAAGVASKGGRQMSRQALVPQQRPSQSMKTWTMGV